MSPDLLKLIFGRLGLDSLPLHEPILVGTFVMVALGGEPVFVAGACTPDAPQGQTTASIKAPADAAPLLGAGLKRPAFTPQKSSSFFLGQRPKSDS